MKNINVTDTAIQKHAGAWIHIAGSVDIDVVDTLPAGQQVILEIDLQGTREVEQDDSPCVNVFPQSIVSEQHLSYSVTPIPNASTVAERQLQIVCNIVVRGHPNNRIAKIGYTAAVPFNRIN